jgi:hypothetical protein
MGIVALRVQLVKRINGNQDNRRQPPDETDQFSFGAETRLSVLHVDSGMSTARLTFLSHGAQAKKCERGGIAKSRRSGP